MIYFNPKVFAGFALAASALLSNLASASPILLDRGLPTINLNGELPNRSNVAWVEGGYTAANYWLKGDTFTNTTGSAWTIDTITMWAVRDYSSASLWGAVSGATPTVVASTGVLGAPVFYSGLDINGNNTYQSQSGFYRDMFQIDFAVNFTLAAGATYDFYLDGLGAVNTVPFAHASNAALSGSAQAGSDDLMLRGNVVNGAFVNSSRETWTSNGGGWDKASDLNVIVRGNAVPEPASLALVGVALLGLVASRRRSV